MARPTEPGWYWLRTGAMNSDVSNGWEVVCVDPEMEVWRTGWEWPGGIVNYTDDQWGGRITQEPVVDPPPPF